MTTSKPTYTLSVAIDVENILKMVYAESALRYMTHIAESPTTLLLDADRRPIILPMLRNAFAELCTSLNAYITSHNQNTFKSEGLLKIGIAHHKPLSTAGSESIGSLIEQVLYCSILVKAYPQDSSYQQQLTHRRRALLTIFALDEQ